MPEQRDSTAGAEGAPPEKREESIKETLISIIISFALAFVARSYVAEPFVIPTGSMAPTLNGAHMRFHSRFSGYQWASNPSDYNRRTREPLPVQGSRAINFDPIRVVDPMTRRQWAEADIRTRAGDRILVQKYLYAINEPRRWDVVVFKNPEEPATNFIKRLVGLPSEQVALVDGDVFTRPLDEDGRAAGEWRIQRKPDAVQRAVWAPIYSSEYAPRVPITGDWRGPWTGQGWIDEDAALRWPGDAPGALRWDGDRRPVTDSVPYNWTSPGGQGVDFPVSDLRIRAGVEPHAPGLTVAARLEARGHQFEARIGPGGAALRMRPAPEEADAESAPWRTLAESDAVTLPAERVADIEFWHVDQRLCLLIDGRRVLEAAYDWSPVDRLRHATRPEALDDDPINLANPTLYRRPEIRWLVDGAPVTLHRVGLDRDLHYRTIGGPEEYNRAATLQTAVGLNADQFFMLGDNSPASRDGRAWNRVDPWVASALDDTVGVVHRDLMMGRAFFVYFPAPHTNLRGVPIPDFGRLRFIR